MDFVEVWIDGPISIDRDDIEDALNEALLGVGEVTGAGTGQGGSNLDVEVDEDVAKDVVLRKIFTVMSNLGVGDSVRIRPGDEGVWIRLSEWPR